MARTEINDCLAFGDLAACCHAADAEFAVVHACKDPCHRHAGGYTVRSLPAAHPDYLAVARERHLYLNLIDPPVPLFKPESFAIFFDFVDGQIRQRPVLIHCNKGESRAPSLALLYMAKRLKLLPDESYVAARAAFSARFPYKPGDGIALFLEQAWHRLGK